MEEVHDTDYTADDENIVVVDGQPVYIHHDSDEDMGESENDRHSETNDNDLINDRGGAGDSNFETAGPARKRNYMSAMDTDSLNDSRNDVYTARKSSSKWDLQLGIQQLRRDYDVVKAEISLLEDALKRFPNDDHYDKQLFDCKLRKLNLTREIDMAVLELKSSRFDKPKMNGMGNEILKNTSRLNRADEIPIATDENETGSNSSVSLTTETSGRSEIPTTSAKKDDDPNPMIVLAKALMSMAGREKNDDETRVKRSRIHRDLPTFSGAPDAWPNFIAQFHQSTELCDYSDSDNVIRLQRALKDEALTAVKPYLIKGENLSKVLETLEKRFGRPHMVIETLIKKAREIRKVDERNLGDLVTFSCAVDNLVVTMENMESTGHMTNPTLLQEFVEKLPQTMMIDWAKTARQERMPTIRHFADWLRIQADAVSSLNFKILLDEKKKSRSEREVQFATNENSDKKSECTFCRSPGHRIWECSEFKSLEIDDKWRHVTKIKLCFCCLGQNHSSRNCKRARVCGTDGCTMKHHRLLHKPMKKSDEKKSENRQDKPLTSMMQVESKQTIMRILPVTLVSENKTLDTFAYLDGGGSSTLIDAAAAEFLEIKGNKDPLTLGWMSSITKTQNDSRRVQLKIRGTSSDELFDLTDVRTVKNLELPMQSLNYPKLVNMYPHLDGLPVVSYTNAKPLILIGQQDCHLEAPDTVIQGPPKTPIAYDTKLGWCVSGPAELPLNRVDISLLQINNDNDLYLHDLIKKTFEIDDIGIKLTDKLESLEDQKALDLMKQHVRFDGERWEVPALWRDENPKLPDNKSQALMRLYAIEKKMKLDQKYADAYEAKVQDYLKKGYASIVPDNTEFPKGKTWLLPTFGVYNPNKPGKLRFVMDAAAKHQGVCLNDALLKGPDLMCPLIGVLLNFRRYAIAISGDIREMFHQVSVRNVDRCSQLFLWHDKDDYKKKLTLQMNRMTFGSVSSPFCAQYIKNVNADKFAADYPLAAEIIKDHHYVDDCLTSLPDTESAIEAIKNVTYVHQKGGFEIVGWMSNNSEVLASVPLDRRGMDIKTFDDDEQLTERTLGLKWSVKSDEFTFTCKFNRVDDKMMAEDYIPTKRELLKLIMSLYDPLGFVGHFVIKSRIILQDVWRTGTGWDEAIDLKLLPRWRKWLNLLKTITKVRIPRCFSSEVSTAKKLDLHVFADASSQAYGSVAYLLITTENDERKVAFLMSRSRVAPLKPLSIPRMELQAALIASRLSLTIKESLKLPIVEIHYWSDSWTVLCWLRSETRRFQQYVSHRVGEILENTNLNEWHWVPTEVNPADKLTREETPVDTKQESMWFSGPLFLRLDKSEWPKEPEVKPQISKKTLEVRCEPVMLIVVGNQLIDFQRFSSYRKLLNVTAYVLRFLRKLKGRQLFADDAENGQQIALTVRELNVAEKLLIKIAQNESYPEEIKLLRKDKPIPQTSKLLKFCPRITGGGLLRVSGRISENKFDEKLCFPTILDGRHPLSKLIVTDEHEKAFHICQERLVNEVRQRFWITGLRKLVKSISKNCVICKFIRKIPKPQMMGNLPTTRQEMFAKPFSQCGLDYFGPIFTKAGKGRKPNKRYGALFTCLTTRAVHIEMAADLTTDCCLMAIRRMIARRGQIDVLWTDEGRNFLGASRDLKMALENLNNDELLKHLTAKKIDWRFNPPASPHMGGSWESLIKSVKTAIAAVTFDQKFNDETFQTFLAEVEWILNSRPITFVSVDNNDREALTPNHILIGNSGGFTNWEDLNEDRLSLRKRWLHSQQLANQFWKRWMKEYVPTLNIRSKWQNVRDNLKIDEFVLIADDNMPRNLWPKGIIIKVFPGQDGIVRVADIKTNHGIYRRPITRICRLDLNLDEPRSASPGGGMETTAED